MGGQILLTFGCLGLGLAAGFLMHRSDYCLTAAFRDLFLFRSTRMLRALALLVVTTMALFEAARLLGFLPRYPSPFTAPPNGATAFGGLIFGVGMVLAGGCVVGTLYRLGAGSAVSAAAFAGLLLGSGLYAEIHPVWRQISAAAAWPAGPPTLPQALAVSPSWMVLVVLVGGAVAFWHWRRRGAWGRASGARGALEPWKASLALAWISLGAYVLTSMPLGITTCYAKLAAGVESLVAPAHVARLAFFQAVPLNIELPLLGTHLRGGPGPAWDGIAAVQGMVIAGICLGAFGSAALLGEFRPVLRVPPRQYVSALVGGVLLALGSRFSGGCNVWYLMGGLPVLATQSLLFLAGLVPGAGLGAWLFTRLVVPSPGAGLVCAARSAGLPAKGATP